MCIFADEICQAKTWKLYKYQNINPQKIKFMKKRLYKKPAMQVVLLRQQPQLLAGSGLGDPSDYPGGGDPLNPAP